MTEKVADPPRTAHAARGEARRAEAAALAKRERLLSVVRLLLFAVAAALVLPPLFGRGPSALWALLPASAYVAVAVVHDRAIRARTGAERAAAYHEDALARIDERWVGRGPAGESFRDPAHPYAEDLDLFGAGSLFDLLCVARTARGQATLARWLLEPAAPDEIRRRQQAVRELAPKLDLREALAVVGERAAAEVDPRRISGWLGAPHELRHPAIVPVAALAAVANMGALAGWLAGWLSPFVPAFVLVASALLGVALRSRVERVLGAIERPERDLEQLAGLLRLIEDERFESALLVELRAALAEAGERSSERIARLARLVAWIESRRNALFAPLAALGFGGTQLACAVERWRARSASSVERWLDAAGAIEALASLAGRAYERPDEVFPEIVDPGPRYEAVGVGHPLIPDERCVRNDLRLDAELQLLVVSGSNMSGKSTLLRTVGVSTVLALAGGTVRARRLRLSPLTVGASIRVQDSLQAGLSRFYAEIRHLRAIVDLGGGPRPLLFLLDEVLSGTNSHDRRAGAEGLARALVRRGAIGLVTTHDLALAAIADELAPRAANVHFEDRLEEGRVSFDYRLRPGVVTRGNALELMRAVGLEV